MQIEEYKTLAEVTMAKNFHYDTQNPSEPDIYHHCKSVIDSCQKLDLVKKKKFYGREVNISSTAPADAIFKTDGEGGENLIHAAIGICTESSEILENIMRHKYEGAEVDSVNIKEELGDLMWYIAIFLRDLDIDFHDTLALNIAKLEKRFEGKFSEFKANNRNLEQERVLLETGVPIEEENPTSKAEDLAPESHSLLEELFLTTKDGGLVPNQTAFSKLKNDDITLDEQRKIKQEISRLNSKHINLTKEQIENKLSFNEFTSSFLYLQEKGFDIQSKLIVFVIQEQRELRSIFSNFGFSESAIQESITLVETGSAFYLIVNDISGLEPHKILLEIGFYPRTGKLQLTKISTHNNIALRDKQKEYIKSFLNKHNIDIK